MATATAAALLLQEAATLLMEVIQEYPNFADPFHTLGLVHEAGGNVRRALDFHMIAGKGILFCWKMLYWTPSRA
jgi:hypothetical protein